MIKYFVSFPRFWRIQWSWRGAWQGICLYSSATNWRKYRWWLGRGRRGYARYIWWLLKHPYLAIRSLRPLHFMLKPIINMFSLSWVYFLAMDIKKPEKQKRNKKKRSVGFSGLFSCLRTVLFKMAIRQIICYDCQDQKIRALKADEVSSFF